MRIEWIGDALDRGTLGKSECQIAREKCVAACSMAILLPGFNFANHAACVEALCPKCLETGISTPGIPDLPPPPPVAAPEYTPPPSSGEPPPPPPPPPPLKPPPPPVPVPEPETTKKSAVVPVLVGGAILVALFTIFK